MDGRSNPRPWRIRPMPEDFREIVASGITMVDLMAHYQVGAGVLKRWVDDIGGRSRSSRGPQQKTMPADFALWAARETTLQLIHRYRCGTKAVARWRREAGLKSTPPRRQPKTQPVPDGFALMVPQMTMRELKERFGKGKTTIWKWCQVAGVQPRKASTHPPTRAAGHIHVGRKLNPFDGPRRDVSRAGQAADFLRTFAPVVRCNSVGHYDQNGDHWRRGSFVLTADEIIQRATRQGWNPEAWKALAA